MVVSGSFISFQFVLDGSSLSQLVLACFRSLLVLLCTLQNSLHGTAEVSPKLELITEIAWTMTKDSVLQELRKMKAKVTIAREKKRKPIEIVAVK